MKSMIHAACNIFEYSGHPETFRISRQIGTHDGFRNTVVARPREVEDYPLELIFDVNSDLLAFNKGESFFFPVHGQVMFKRVGTRIYEEGQLISVEQVGVSGNYKKTDDGYSEFSGIYD